MKSEQEAKSEREKKAKTQRSEQENVVKISCQNGIRKEKY